jgi:hypothetical protein
MFRRFIVSIASCVLLLGCSKGLPQLPLAVDKDGAFQLKEISLTEALKRQPELGNCGQRMYLGFAKTNFLEDSTVPKKEVKKYPQIKAKKPLYGAVKFDYDYLKPESGVEYQFVIDATGSAGYDRLYFDANRDLDLTNDPPITLSKEPWPAGLWSYAAKDGLLFNEISAPMDFGPGYGVRPVKILPFVFMEKDEAGKEIAARVMFLALSFHAGGIKIGDQRFDAVLAHQYSVSGRFDRPYTTLYLMAPGSNSPFEHWGGDANALSAYHFVNGKYYTIDATSVGDKLFVKPYTGELGTFKLGPGTREIKKMTVDGSLYSPERAVAIGFKDGNREPVTQCQVPVGDYTVSYTRIDYGPLHMTISDNYHTDGIRQDRNKQRKFAVQIRKDKPFVLDFSNKPEILFAGPAKDSVFKPGDEVNVYAVLIDPVLDIMIRSINDTRQKAVEEIDLGDGKKETRVTDKNKSLDPVVTITDSSGKTVAEGPMPFG